MTAMHSAYFAAGTVPVTVTFPATTVTVAPVQPAFFKSSLIFPVSAGSDAAGVATGNGLRVVLSTTEVTPSTDFADALAFAFTVTSATWPLSVATPLFTVAVTPVTPSAASLSFTAFVRSASLFPHAAATATAAMHRTDKIFVLIFLPLFILTNKPMMIRVGHRWNLQHTAF